MIRFEEEISRLAPRHQVVISAPPVQSLTIKPLPSMTQYQPLAAAPVYNHPMQIKLPTTYTSIGNVNSFISIIIQ